MTARFGSHTWRGEVIAPDPNDGNYDNQRGQALLHGDHEAAKAAQFEDAVDRRGVHIDDEEAALADPDLDPKLATSKDPAEVKRHDAAIARHNKIELDVDHYGKGTIYTHATGKDELQEGKDDRARAAREPPSQDRRRRLLGEVLPSASGRRCRDPQRPRT